MPLWRSTHLPAISSRQEPFGSELSWEGQEGRGDVVREEAITVGSRDAALFPTSPPLLVSNKLHWEKGKQGEMGGLTASSGGECHSQTLYSLGSTCGPSLLSMGAPGGPGSAAV